MNFKNNKYNIYTWIFAIIIGVSGIVLSQIFTDLKIKDLQQKSKLEASSFGTDLIVHVENELNSLKYLSSGLEYFIKLNHSSLDSEIMDLALKETVGASEIINNIAVAEGYKVSYVYPLKGNESVLNIDYTKIPGQWPSFKRAIDTKEGTLDGPVKLVQGGEALIYRKPIFIKGSYWGMISIVINMDKFTEFCLKDMEKLGYNFAIRTVYENAHYNMIYGLDETFYKEHSVRLETKLPNGIWEYVIAQEISSEETRYYNIVFWLLVAFSLSLSVFILFFGKFRNEAILKNKQYHLLAKNISDIIWVYDLDKEQYSFVSPNISEHLGFSVNDVLNGKVDFKEAFKGEEEKCECEIAHKNGTPIWVETSGKVVSNTEKSKGELVGISRTINRRKEFENQLKDSEQRLKTIVNSTFAGICILDKDGNYIFCNPNSETILGYKVEELLKLNYFDLIHEDEKELARTNLFKIYYNKLPFISRESRMLNSDGSYVWIKINAIRIPATYNPNEYEILIVFQDLSSQKEHQDQLQSHLDFKDRFISVLAHDLKGPFGNIIGVLELLNNKIEVGSTEQKHLAKVALNTSYETIALLDNLLNWARIQQNQITLREENINLYKLVMETTRLFASQLANKQIECINNTDPDIFVLADEEMIKTVIRNILSNAIKYSPKHGTIRIHSEQINDKVSIRIKDNGIGMNQQTINSLFDIEATQSKVGTEGEKGTGFGLVVCKDFIELHNGNIHVDSEFGLGTVFTIELPKTNTHLI